MRQTVSHVSDIVYVLGSVKRSAAGETDSQSRFEFWLSYELKMAGGTDGPSSSRIIV